MDTKKGKHLILDDRLEIQACLSHGMSFKDIATRIGKDQTTVSKEIKRHIKVHTNSFVNTDKCCPYLLKAPFVCNACQSRSRSNCHFPRHIYDAKTAQAAYESLLVEAREGIPLNKESFYETEKLISSAVRKGQHIYHILKTNNIPISVSTVYRYIHNGYYSIGNIDLPRAVKFKLRRPKHREYIPSCVKKGRTFDEFNQYCSDHNIISYVELDTVIGHIGGKAIVTLHFTAFNFMFGLLVDDKTSGEVALKINKLKQRLSEKSFLFSDIFPVILTDNGGEFSCVTDIENTENDVPSKLFFCEPNMPSQKPRIEKNHTLFRDIVPKGTSFDNFTQSTVNLIFSHVNAVKRKIFNGKSAYDMFCFSFSEELAKILGITYIAPEDVIQSPRLLKNII